MHPIPRKRRAALGQEIIPTRPPRTQRFVSITATTAVIIIIIFIIIIIIFFLLYILYSTYYYYYWICQNPKTDLIT